MDAAAQPLSRRLSRIRSRLPKKQVVDLANKGLNSVEIGKIVDADPSTIRRFIQKIQPEFQWVKDFRSNRADALTTLQAKNLAVQEKILERLSDEGLLSSLTPQQMSGLVFALNTQHGTLYDKERLELGQSTANLSIMSRMINETISGIYVDGSAKTTSTTSQVIEENPSNIMQDSESRMDTGDSQSTSDNVYIVNSHDAELDDKSNSDANDVQASIVPAD